MREVLSDQAQELRLSLKKLVELTLEIDYVNISNETRHVIYNSF
jgi:hypothetical protein